MACLAVLATDKQRAVDFMVSTTRSPRILVLGDVMVDRWWLGSAARLSPEAPIPVTKIDKIIDCPGGAGNVAANLKALGAAVWCPNQGDRQVPIKNRLMVNDVQLARWDENDTCEAITNISYGQWDAVVVADYCKGAVGPAVVDYVRKFCIPKFIDTKGNPSLWAGIPGVTIFPNTKEYSTYFDEYYNNFSHIVHKKSAHGVEETLISRFDGRVFDAKREKIPSWAKFVCNVSGAGDTLTAAYAYATLVGYPDPLAFANAAAAVVVEKPLTATASLQEVLDRLKEVGYPNAGC